MKTRTFGFILVCLMIAQAFLSSGFINSVRAQASPDVFVGVDVAYGDVAEAKAMVDKVSNYTNLFIIGCTAITHNTTKLSDICQYIYDKNLYFIVYLDWPPSAQWLEEAKTKWGTRFLGFYAYDEVGGRQLDLVKNWTTVSKADNYSDAATQFINVTNGYLHREWYAFTRNYAYPGEFPLFTSDYALYWFDYKAGYDTVFAEFGWNYSRQINVALCRGAATFLNKDWGAMITWTYTTPPYIESGENLYKDMMFAYDEGAKYIVIFDANEGWTQGILKDEHLQAMQQFWQHIQSNGRKNIPISERVAYVLPNGYGFGFRGPYDSVWGLWQWKNVSSADKTLAYNISVTTGSLLDRYGSKLDIIYDEGLGPGDNHGYSQLIFWGSESPTPQPTSLPSKDPTWTPEPEPPISLPATAIIISIVSTAVVVALATFVVRKRH
jgi:hypothetical protein